MTWFIQTVVTAILNWIAAFFGLKVLKEQQAEKDAAADQAATEQGKQDADNAETPTDEQNAANELGGHLGRQP